MRLRIALALTSAVAVGIGASQLYSSARRDEPDRRPNRLIHEKSPYLLQHAYNPVDWYPWGEEAFEKARAENKPIFLSVGYSTCHWCHVMERESFDNPEIAAQINEGFIPIKVDREERPDVDRVYMNAAFAMTGGGGWPLTVFLTPAREPFYAGTYFPPEDRYGRPGLPTVLRGISRTWTEQRNQVLSSASRLTDAIRNTMKVVPDSIEIQLEERMALAYEQLGSRYDERLGGFGPPPKFPQPVYFNFLLRWWSRTDDARAKTMTLETLRKMARGGIHDRLGGGFHRYSTDGQWRVPHFEKMLYDQAQLGTAYIEGWQASGDVELEEAARGILEYVARELRHPDGGFYSAEDADSPTAGDEPEEGAYYVWTVAEVESILGKERARLFLRLYDIRTEGNWEHGKNVLYVTRALEEFATEFGLEVGVLRRRLEADRLRLLRARERRARPHLDDKILTAWNGLMISAYARAAQVWGEKRWLQLASEAANFILEHSYDRRSNSLNRRWREGEAAIPGMLTDYAYFVQGLLDLYEAGFEIRYLQRAFDLTNRQIELFWDADAGGFYETGEGASPELLVRSKEWRDGVEPSGNSVSVLNLVRLSQMIGDEELERKARRTLNLMAARPANRASSLAYLWVAADMIVSKPAQVVIAGKPEANDTRELLHELNREFRPRKVVLLADGDRGQRWLARQQPFLESVEPIGGAATAYVCVDFVCQLPTTSTIEMARQLTLAVKESRAAGPPDSERRP